MKLFGLYISRTDWKSIAASAAAKYQHMKLKNRVLTNELNELKAQLKQAKKNDYRDEKERFKKRPDPIVEESKKAICWNTVKGCGK